MRPHKGHTLLEVIIAFAIIVVILAAMLPQFRNVQQSWGRRSSNAEFIQNSRILSEHLNRNLSSAKRIISVSAPSESMGSIVFKNNAGQLYKYELGADGFIQFGPDGSTEDLAGPATQFTFECFSLDDLDNPTTVAGDIRLVKITTTMSCGQDPVVSRTVCDQVFLQAGSAVSHLLVWYKFDEASGLSAADSSLQQNTGQLTNMTGSEWTNGPLDGALGLDGLNDYVKAAAYPAPAGYSATIAGWGNLTQVQVDGAELASLGDEFAVRLDYALYGGTSGFYRDGVWPQATGNGTYYANTGWHHFAFVLDWENHKRRLYIDGQLKTEQSYTSAVAWGQEPFFSDFTIGRHPDLSYSQYMFRGFVDDIRLYDVALTTTEIQNLCPPLPIHHWKLDDQTAQAADSTGSMTGTYRNGALRRQPASRSFYGYSAYFDGTNDWISLPTNAYLRTMVNNFSVSAWVKPLSDNRPSWIVGRDAATCGWSLGMTDTSLIFRVHTREDYQVDYVLPLNQWSHVAVVFGAGNDASFFVNGQLAGTVLGSSDAKSGGASIGWAIGRCSTSGYFKGWLDDIRIYNYSLTPEQATVVAGKSATTDPYLSGSIVP